MALPVVAGSAVTTGLVALTTGTLRELVVLSISAAILSALAARVFLPSARSRASGQCAKCGYDLTGNESGVCPECGVPVDARAKSVQTASQQHRECGAWAFVASVAVLTLGLSIVGRVVATRSTVGSTADAELIARLSSPEATVHEPAINALVARGKTPLLSALKHPDPWVRRNAVRGLLLLSDSSTGTELVGALDDCDPWVRMWAARALAQIGDTQAVGPLLRRRNDPEAFVRDSVCRALSDLGVSAERSSVPTTSQRRGQPESREENETGP